MYDMHSHFLPGIDDGAKSIDISFKMIEASVKKGVTHLLSTSHCYPYNNADIEDFIYDRGEAFKKLTEAAQERKIDLPEIKLASEVHMTRDLTKFQSLDKLCIQGTNYMLVEMPSSPWTDVVVDTVYKMTIMGFKPIIAHMERNLHQNSGLIEALYDLDVLIQVNAESFAIPQLKKSIDNLFRQKLLHLIGTDMHNLESRKPNIDAAEKSIKKRYGKECIEYIMSNAESVWNGEAIEYSKMKSFKKKILFGL